MEHKPLYVIAYFPADGDHNCGIEQVISEGCELDDVERIITDERPDLWLNVVGYRYGDGRDAILFDAKHKRIDTEFCVGDHVLCKGLVPNSDIFRGIVKALPEPENIRYRVIDDMGACHYFTAWEMFRPVMPFPASSLERLEWLKDHDNITSLIYRVICLFDDIAYNEIRVIEKGIFSFLFGAEERVSLLVESQDGVSDYHAILIICQSINQVSGNQYSFIKAVYNRDGKCADKSLIAELADCRNYQFVINSLCPDDNVLSMAYSNFLRDAAAAALSTEEEIYRLEVDVCLTSCEQERSHVTKNYSVLFLTDYNEAVNKIQELVQNDTEKFHYCYRVVTLPLNRQLVDREYKCIDLFDAGGKHVDNTRCSGIYANRREDGNFYGCPEDVRRFNVGDFVEYIDCDKVIRHGVVTACPMTPEDVWEHYENTNPSFIEAIIGTDQFGYPLLYTADNYSYEVATDDKHNPIITIRAIDLMSPVDNLSGETLTELNELKKSIISKQ